MTTNDIRVFGPFNYAVEATKYKTGTKKSAKVGSASFRGYNTARKAAHKLLNDHNATEVTMTITRVASTRKGEV